MEIGIKVGSVLNERADLGVLCVFEGQPLPAEVANLVEAEDFRGSANEKVLLYPRGAVSPRRLLLIGIGSIGKANVEQFRQVGALADFARRRRPGLELPPVVAGDLNAEPDSAEIRYLTGLQSLEGRSMLFYDAWRVGGDGGTGITWSNRNPYARVAIEPDRRIDYVLVGYPQPTGVGRVETCRVACHEPRDGVWPSDHFGVYAELRTEPIPDLGSYGG